MANLAMTTMAKSVRDSARRGMNRFMALGDRTGFTNGAAALSQVGGLWKEARHTQFPGQSNGSDAAGPARRRPAAVKAWGAAIRLAGGPSVTNPTGRTRRGSALQDFIKETER